MKKIIACLLALSAVFSMSIIGNQTEAIDFAKEESKYIKLCSSGLTSSNKKVCTDFNAYLKKKNGELSKTIKDNKADISETKDSIEAVSTKIDEMNTEISKKQKEIDYLLSSISDAEKNISKIESEMEERLYTMQTFYNSNSYLDIIFGAENFSDFFSRVSSMNEITSYEKDNVDKLIEYKEVLATQKKSLNDAKAVLQAKKDSQVAMKSKLNTLKKEQESELAGNQKDKKEVSAAQKKIDQQLASLIDNAPSKGGGGGSYNAGSSDVGNAVAQKALTRLGCRYWWGANGPSYFDCSGLVYWAHNQAGVSLGRSTAAGYAGSGKSVSRSELQTGDVITFSYGSGVSHIGIYIGGGSFVHASGRGSGTVGQYPDQCVKTAQLSGYWEKYVYNYRRLY